MVWKVLRWFGHVERMDEHRMARRGLMVDVSKWRVRWRPRLGWNGWCEGFPWATDE